MVKVQDTYNPVTGEYVKRISDWVSLTGDLAWTQIFSNSKFRKFQVPLSSSSVLNQANVYRYDSKKLDMYSSSEKEGMTRNGGTSMQVYLSNEDSGISSSITPTTSEIKAYFFGHKMCNADGTSPYYKSEVPYTPATWAEWSASGGGVVNDSSGITFTSDGVNWMVSSFNTALKSNTKYGILYNVVSSTISGNLLFVAAESFGSGTLPKTSGNQKLVSTTITDTTGKKFAICTGSTEPLGNQIKLKDIRIFELPTGSQIESDFTNLTADQLSAKYTFNGLCIKNWKKVTDGTGLTSTLPTASYAGYTPYKMIYQLATPEISYLTPKATIPLYDTNTIVETDTLADCKADVTVGYKLKSGVTAVAGDITAPTPDYMSAVNSVSEDGDKKGIVRGKNLLSNKNPTTLTNAGITYTKGSDGSITLNGTSTSQSQYILAENITLKKGTYRFSGGVNYATLNFVENGNWIMVGNVEKTFTKDYTGNIILLTYDAGRVFSNVKIYPQLEEGSVATAFETYKTPVQATLPTLRKIGTVADTYNPETGVLVQRIGKKVFDGTESWLQDASAVGYRHTTSLTNAPTAIDANSSNIGMAKSTHFNLLNQGLTAASITGFTIAGGNLFVYKKGELITQFKAYLAQQYANGTPVTVYHQLATPIVTTLATTALPTYKPTTVIESDSTVKGNVSADYKLKVGATPVAGDFIASPESVNDIKDLGNSIDVVSSVGARNLIQNSMFADTDFNGLADGFTRVGVHTGSLSYIDVTETSISPVSQKIVRNGAPNVGIAHSVKSVIGHKYFFRGYGKASGVGGCKMNIGYMYNHSSDYYSKSIDNNAGWVEGYKVFTSISENIHVNNFPIEDTAWANGWYLVDLTKTFGSGNEPTEQWCIDNLVWKPSPEETPYNIATRGVYKTNILLANPLRSVGAVKDRLFKDSDGKWKVERNIGEKAFDGTEIFAMDGTDWVYWTNYIGGTYYVATAICSHAQYAIKTAGGAGNFTNSGGGFLEFFSRNMTSTGFKSWLTAQYNAGTPVTVQYQLATPTYETLSQELQTDLDNIPTFPEHNYVYTVTNDNLQPTLHVDYKKLSWLKSRLLLNSLKIYSRNLTDAEMIQNYKVEKERFGM